MADADVKTGHFAATDELYSYLVTAVNAAGTATSPGAGTDGTPRSLSTLACP